MLDNRSCVAEGAFLLLDTCWGLDARTWKITGPKLRTLCNFPKSSTFRAGYRCGALCCYLNTHKHSHSYRHRPLHKTQSNGPCSNGNSKKQSKITIRTTFCAANLNACAITANRGLSHLGPVYATVLAWKPTFCGILPPV